jgi:hypothetical protein|tara:strand:- start:656 stop:769 length:114 start_codon:yes stop_codon:yes gene_type:complete
MKHLKNKWLWAVVAVVVIVVLWQSGIWTGAEPVAVTE